MIIVGGCCYSNLSVKFLFWIVYVPSYIVDYSGLRSRCKNDTVPSPPPELLVSMSVTLAPELSFLMAPALASVRFHTFIFYCLALPQVEWKMN